MRWHCSLVWIWSKTKSEEFVIVDEYAYMECSWPVEPRIIGPLLEELPIRQWLDIVLGHVVLVVIGGPNVIQSSPTELTLG